MSTVTPRRVARIRVQMILNAVGTGLPSVSVSTSKSERLSICLGRDATTRSFGE